MRFPALKTGAFAQYPVTRAQQFRTDVVRFIDGTEQRYRLHAAARKRWIVKLELLDDTELNRLADFFFSGQGRAGRFEFEDPWTGTVIPNCSFEIDELTAELAGEGRAGTVLIIRENAA